jgi:hypothetical protein
VADFEKPSEAKTSDASGFPRRPLVAHLNALKTALTALKPAVPADLQSKFDAILKSINQIIDVAMDRNSIDIAIVQRVRQMATELKPLVPTQPAPVASGTGN